MHQIVFWLGLRTRLHWESLQGVGPPGEDKEGKGEGEGVIASTNKGGWKALVGLSFRRTVLYRIVSKTTLVKRDD